MNAHDAEAAAVADVPLPPLDAEGLDPVAVRGSIVRTLVRGKWSKSDVSVVSLEGRPAVLKDYAVRRSRLVRLYGRIQTRREARAYRVLDGVEGVPRLWCRLDPYALLIEHVEGERITRSRYRPEAGQNYRELERIVERMHGRGIVHGDLRARDNALVDDVGRVHLIDFASALYFPQGSWQHRWLFPILRQLDRSALLKFKRLLAPQTLSTDERRRERWLGRLGLLWLINPKAWIAWWKRRID